MDLQEAFDAGFEAVKAYVDGVEAAMADRLAAIEKRLDDLPEPKDGKDADEAAITAKVYEKIAAIPTPKDGKDGDPGKDGVGLAGAVIDRDGNLVLTMTDGSTKDLGVVVGKDGDPGKPGRDGFSLTDFDAKLMEDGRTVLMSFDRGDQSFHAELGIPAMIYRGVFRDGQSYERGDTVTWGGSLWHCDAEETIEKPDSAEKHWTLAAKRGRDGKDFKPEKVDG